VKRLATNGTLAERQGLTTSASATPPNGWPLSCGRA
jgi:hypothetical protein